MQVTKVTKSSYIFKANMQRKLPKVGRGQKTQGSSTVTLQLTKRKCANQTMQAYIF